jgi:DNA replication protein DnaC
MALEEITKGLAKPTSKQPLSSGLSSTIDPEVALQHKVDAINEISGALAHYDCPICHNKGYVAYAKDGSIWTRHCECMDKRESLRLIERSGLSSTLATCTFETFQTPEQWQADAKAKAMDFVADHEGKWFLAAGAVGSGKTHLCTAICGQLLSLGVPVRYMLWRDVCGRLKASVNDNDEFERIIGPLKRVPVLYIDDFFKTEQGRDPTTADVNIAFELLNVRYVDRAKVTIISTERSPEKLCAIDEAVGSRIYERCKGNILFTQGDVKNWRMR